MSALKPYSESYVEKCRAKDFPKGKAYIVVGYSTPNDESKRFYVSSDALAGTVTITDDIGMSDAFSDPEALARYRRSFQSYDLAVNQAINEKGLRSPGQPAFIEFLLRKN